MCVRIETVASEIEESVIKVAMAMAHRATQEIITAQLSKVFKKKLIPTVTSTVTSTATAKETVAVTSPSPIAESIEVAHTPTPTPTPTVATLRAVTGEMDAVKPKAKSRAKPKAAPVKAETETATVQAGEGAEVEAAVPSKTAAVRSRAKKGKSSSASASASAADESGSGSNVDGEVIVVVAKQAAKRKPKSGEPPLVNAESSSSSSVGVLGDKNSASTPAVSASGSTGSIISRFSIGNGELEKHLLQRMKSLQATHVKTDGMPREHVVLSDDRRKEYPTKEVEMEAEAVVTHPLPSPVSVAATATPSRPTAPVAPREFSISSPERERASESAMKVSAEKEAVQKNIPVAAAAVKPLTLSSVLLSEVGVKAEGEMVQEVMALPVKGGFVMPVGLTDAAYGIGYERAVELFRESCGISSSSPVSASASGVSAVASKVSRSQGEGALRAGILKELLNHPEYGTAHVVGNLTILVFYCIALYGYVLTCIVLYLRLKGRNLTNQIGCIIYPSLTIIPVHH